MNFLKDRRGFYPDISDPSSTMIEISWNFTNNKLIAAGGGGGFATIGSFLHRIHFILRAEEEKGNIIEITSFVTLLEKGEKYVSLITTRTREQGRALYALIHNPTGEFMSKYEAHILLDPEGEAEAKAAAKPDQPAVCASDLLESEIDDEYFISRNK